MFLRKSLIIHSIIIDFLKILLKFFKTLNLFLKILFMLNRQESWKIKINKIKTIILCPYVDFIFTFYFFGGVYRDFWRHGRHHVGGKEGQQWLFQEENTLWEEWYFQATAKDPLALNWWGIFWPPNMSHPLILSLLIFGWSSAMWKTCQSMEVRSYMVKDPQFGLTRASVYKKTALFFFPM